MKVKEMACSPASPAGVDVAAILKDLGLTPYSFVRQALRDLSDGDYSVAFGLIEYAGTFRDSFYRPGSTEAKDFSETIKLLRYLVLHLAHEFGLTDPSPADPGEGIIQAEGE